jgi:hypothetical protein
MTVEYGNAVTEALKVAPLAVRKAFFKQVKFLEQNLHHPSLRAKKYDEAKREEPGTARVFPLFFLLSADHLLAVEVDSLT